MRLYYVRNNELYHHGIKGMRWGIRRFQKKDGTLTAAGKKRYSDDDSVEKEKSQHRLKLEKHYRDRGMSAKEAEDAAQKRIKTETILGVTAGVTLAACATYVARKHIKERTDGIIKSGTKLQRVTVNPDDALDKAFYTSYKESDNAKYRGLYGMSIDTAKNPAHRVSLNADKDLRVVSRQKAADVFVDLYKNDPEFKSAFERSNSKLHTFGQVPKRDKVVKIASGKMSEKQLKRAGYDAFNIGLANHDADGNAIAKKFYDKLKTMGYDAVTDINDQKYSGYGAKSPVIVFDKSNKVSISDVKKLTKEQMMADTRKSMIKIVGTSAAKYGAKTAGFIMASKFAARTLDDVKVNNHRSEHPNSGMTDKEILEMLNKENTAKRG